WPAGLWHYPNRIGAAEPPVLGSHIVMVSKPEASEQQNRQVDRMEELRWHAACHKLFLLYRNTLREVWREARLPNRFAAGRLTPGDLPLPTSVGWFMRDKEMFLLGLSDVNQQVLEGTKTGSIH